LRDKLHQFRRGGGFVLLRRVGLGSFSFGLGDWPIAQDAAAVSRISRTRNFFICISSDSIYRIAFSVINYI